MSSTRGQSRGSEATNTTHLVAVVGGRRLRLFLLPAVRICTTQHMQLWVSSCARHTDELATRKSRLQPSRRVRKHQSVCTDTSPTSCVTGLSSRWRGPHRSNCTFRTAGSDSIVSKKNARFGCRHRRSASVYHLESQQLALGPFLLAAHRCACNRHWPAVLTQDQSHLPRSRRGCRWAAEAAPPAPPAAV